MTFTLAAIYFQICTSRPPFCVHAVAELRTALSFLRVYLEKSSSLEIFLQKSGGKGCRGSENDTPKCDWHAEHVEPKGNQKASEADTLTFCPPVSCFPFSTKASHRNQNSSSPRLVRELQPYPSKPATKPRNVT